MRVDYDIVSEPIQIQLPLGSVPASPVILVPAAVNGIDYKKLRGSVTLPAKAASVAIVIQPIDDQLVEGREYVTLKLKPSAAYNSNQPDTATVIIGDNDLVNLAPVVSILTPKGGQTFTAPADIQLAAQASDTGGFVKTVEFFANGKSLGVTTAKPMSASPINPFQFLYTLIAKAKDASGLSVISPPVTITVPFQ